MIITQPLLHPKPPAEIHNHHKYYKCEGCGKQRKGIIWFCGHWLCGHCKIRKNMPLVGYKDKKTYNFEKKLISKVKGRYYPSLTWNEQQVLWRKYDKFGLTHNEKKARINGIKSKIRWSHQAYHPK